MDLMILLHGKDKAPNLETREAILKTRDGT